MGEAAAGAAAGAAAAAAVAAAPTKLAQHVAGKAPGKGGAARGGGGKGGRRGAGAPENPINDMKQWATHCEKELASHDKWTANWGEAFFPDGTVWTTDARVVELEARARGLEQKERDAAEARKCVEIDSHTPFKRTSKGGLKPAYPYRG